MGEVYRAHDSRLGRDVAIKVLSGDLCSNPDLKARFEREARAISALSHPHICHLYDVGSQDGTDYLVMELLEGESLQRRLERGPLPVSQALQCAIEIAEALEKAHKSGIVHRDLKPGERHADKIRNQASGFRPGKTRSGPERDGVGVNGHHEPAFNPGRQDRWEPFNTWRRSRFRDRKRTRAPTSLPSGLSSTR